MIIACAAIATLSVGWPSLFYPFGRDQGIFGIIGHVWREGGLPYRDAWDFKPPFVFGAYSLAETLFGYSQGSIRILDLIAVGITAALLAATARKSGALASFVAAVGYPLVYYLSFGFWETAQAESFALPFTAAAMLFVVNKRPQLWIGLCIGMAAMFKPTFIFLALPSLCFHRPKGRDWLIYGCAIATPAAITTLYFTARGGWGLLYDQIQLIRAYASPIPPGGVKFTLLGAIRGTPFLHVIALIGVASVISWRDRLVRLAWLWWFSALLMVVVQGRYFAYHLLPMTPPTVFLLCMAVGEGQTSLVIRRGALIGAFAVAALYSTLNIPYFTRSQQFTGMFGFDSKDDVRASNIIASLPGRSLWVDAFEPNLYFNTRRYPPVRHLSNAPIVGERQIPKAIRDRLANEVSTALTARPPDVLVKTDNQSSPTVVSYGRTYQFAAEAGHYRIYRISPTRLQPTAVADVPIR